MSEPMLASIDLAEYLALNRRAVEAERLVAELRAENEKLRRADDEYEGMAEMAKRMHQALREIVRGSARAPTPQALLARAVQIAQDALEETP